MRNSVVWYFQRIAEKLGMARERDYLKRFDYGNADPSSGLTTFWLGQSLMISPDEQLRFLRRFYCRGLPGGRPPVATGGGNLVPPPGPLLHAGGGDPFPSPVPAGARRRRENR